MKKVLTILAGILLVLLIAGACTVSAKADGESGLIPVDEAHFPDVAFRAYLSRTYDYDADGYIDPETVVTINTDIYPRVEQDAEISDLQGIELFVNLEYLRLRPCKLQSCDCSGNTQLKQLRISSDTLTSLNLTGNPQLKELNISSNSLTSLNLTGNPQLRSLDLGRTDYFYYGNNGIGENGSLAVLDCSANDRLEYLWCSGHQLEELILPETESLNTLDCAYNKLTELDLAGLAQLRSLECSFNQLTTLNLSDLTQLNSLRCNSNQLTALDLSTNQLLRDVVCSFNVLQELILPDSDTFGELDCRYNNLSSLDVRGCEILERYIQSGRKENWLGYYGSSYYGKGIVYWQTDGYRAPCFYENAVEHGELAFDLSTALITSGGTISDHSDAVLTYTPYGGGTYILSRGQKAEITFGTAGFGTEPVVYWPEYYNITSDHPEIVSVDEKGTLTALSEGTAVITSTSKNYPDSPPETITVRVILQTCTVSFMDGDTELTALRRTVDAGTTVPRPADPVKAGYSFLGWQLSGADYDFSRPVTSDLTLTAVWKAAPPVLESVENSAKTIELRWTVSGGADAYRIYRKRTGGSYIVIGTAAGTSYSDKDAEVGIKYTYKIAAMTAGTSKFFSNELEIVRNPFRDVPVSASYFSSVVWAYNLGITTGTTSVTFSPYASCTRYQFAVMMYRLAGKPSVAGKTIPFTDVYPSDTYYKAVVWAYNRGIISGTSRTTFSPRQAVTRYQVVQMLYKMAGKPQVSGTNPFTDVSPQASYYNAVLWAVQKGITKGTSVEKFSPNAECQRYQMVVFLNKFNKIYHIIQD